MRIAAFQRFPIYDDEAAIADALYRDLCWADSQGIHLALFPECHVLGHSYDASVIAARARRTDGEFWRGLLARLTSISATAILGAFERHDGYITNSAIVVEGGRITGRYAKAYPNEAGVAAGRDFPVFTRPGIRFGINICYDANHPDAAQYLADQGAALICYPLNNMMKPATADIWRTRSVENLQARARQTGCWIMSADVTGSHDRKLSYGATMIVDPDGEIVARAAEQVEDVAMFDLPRTLASELPGAN
jgi:predicted amidohydrolase